MKKRILSLFLVVCLTASLAGVGAAVGTLSAFNSAQEAQAGIVNYYQNEKTELTVWEELVALKTAGADLTRFYLPDTAAGESVSSITNAMICELMKGYIPTDLADQLLTKQDTLGNGKFSAIYNEQAWAMIALNAAGISYDKIAAAKYLLEKQLSDGGFNYNGDSGSVSDADTTGAVAVAISPVLGDEAFNTVGYQLQIQKIKDFFKNNQQSDGSFDSWGMKNASSTASAVWGLMALGEDLNSADYVKNGNSLIDALLSFVTKEDTGSEIYGYAYGYDWSDWTNPVAIPSQFDDFYTRQALIALTDIVNRQSSSSWNGVYNNLSQYVGNYKYRTVTVRVDSLSANIENKKITAKSGENQPPTVKDAIEQATGDTISGASITSLNGVSAGDGEEWLIFVDGAQQPLTYELQDSNKIEVLLSKTSGSRFYTYFGQDVVSNRKMGDAITLTLTCKNIDTLTTETKAGLVLQVNGTDYNSGFTTTNASGQATLTFNQAGTYEISARLPASESSYSITRPYCKIVIPEGDSDTKTVNVRVEGISSNIIDERSFDVTTTGDRLLTVADALEQALLENGITYTESDGYFSSINGESAATFGGWDGWMGLVNGASLSVGMGSYVLSGGEDIVVYYGDFNTLYPKISGAKQPDGSYRMTFTADGYDESWNPVQLPIAGATATWDNTAYTTNESGVVTIPPENAAAGQHSLQIQKNGTHKAGTELYLPGVVRLPADYKTTIFNTASDLSSAVSTDTIAPLTIPSGAEYTSIKVSENTPLPEISVSVTDGGLSLFIPQGTTVTASGDSWDGEIGLPEVTSNITISGKTVDKTITAGVGGRTLTFSKPVRILIPGGAGKTIAYLDESGNPVVIDTAVSADNAASAAASLTAASATEGKIDVGSDTAVWTKHFTTFVSYVTTESGGGAGGAGSVTLSVTGYNGQTFLASTSVTLQSGDTPLSVLKRSGLSVSVSSGYVRSINGLSEFDHGSQSGWMYSVNGNYAQTGAGSYLLSSGDKVRWKYTTDLGTDLGAGYVAPVAEILLSEAQKEYKESLDKVMAKIKSKSELSEWELYSLCAMGTEAGDAHLASVIAAVKEREGNIRKPTDIAKYMLAVAMAGGDPTNAGGYDLAEMLYQNDNLLLQGINGPIFALIALNSGYYNVPEDALWTKERLKNYILEGQNADGGYSLEKGEESDVDLTAMALCALAVYKDQAAAGNAIDAALDYLSRNQQQNGGFLSRGVNNTESTAQVIIALTALGIDPLADTRFIKNEKTALSALTSFMLGDNTFTHGTGNESDDMATEQATLALIASYRFFSGEAPLYLIRPYYYDDLGNASAWAQEHIVSATQRGIINGNNGCFRPGTSVTRAEFAAMLVRMLKLNTADTGDGSFSDVPAASWYKDVVAAAQKNNIISGSNGKFYPDRKITREEMAVMIARALALSDDAYQTGIGDLNSVSSWATEGVKAVFASKLMQGSGKAFLPAGTVTREMAATVCARSLGLMQ